MCRHRRYISSPSGVKGRAGVTDDLGMLPTGQRVRRLRERAGMSRAVPGGLVGRSAEWVKAVETGRLLTPRLPILLRLARALNVDDLALLTGNGIAVPVENFSSPAHSALDAVRAALTDYRLVGSAGGPVDPRHLAIRLEQAWAIRHSSPDHRTAVGSILPGLIRDTQRSVKKSTGEQRVELRRSGDAARRAARFHATAIASVARRSRHLVEVARAHHQRGDSAATYVHLLDALNTAPETVRFNAYARDMALALLAAPPAGMTTEVRQLAAGIGVAA